MRGGCRKALVDTGAHDRVIPLRAHDISFSRALAVAIYDRAGNLLLERGSMIVSERQRDRLLELGFIADEGRAPAGRGAVPVAFRAAAADATTDAAAVPVFEAMRMLAHRLQLLHNQLLSGTTGHFEASLMGMAAQIDALAERDADAALASMHLQASEDGLGPRLVHAAVLCRVLAAALQLDEAQRRSTLAAALTYDVALTPITPALNRQNAPLTPAQRAAVDAHPGEACDLLRQAGIDDAVWLDAVMQHHERVDGSGYPQRLQGDSISLPGRMLGIVDSYSAMVRPRAYRDAVLSRQALRDLFLERSRSVDERLANLFVKEVGMYPPGSLVRLANREIAVVARRGAGLGHPQVHTVVYADGTVASTHPMRDTREPGAAIVEGVPLQKYRSILAGLDRLWMPG